MLGQLVVLLSLAVMAAFTLYLWRVPAGPACPRCGTLTRHRVSARPAARPLPVRLILGDGLRMTSAECPLCGWRGRLRRQPPEPAQARSSRRAGR